MKRAVLATSTSCLDYLDVPHQVLSIHQHLTINHVEFLDGHNVSIDKLQRLLIENPNSTMYTEPASEQEIMNLFVDLQSQGYEEILVITHSVNLSQSFNIINKVKDEFLENSNNQMRIFVLDSHEINFAQGLMTLDANEMFLKGDSVAEIVTHLETLNEHHTTLFVVEDLSYLIRSKRISSPVGFMADMFDIKLMLEIRKSGKIVPIKKVRSVVKAIETMVDMLGEKMAGQRCFPYILNAGNPELAEYTAQVIESRLGLKDLIIAPVSPVSVATHGPNTVGFGAFIKEIPNLAELFAKKESD